MKAGRLSTGEANLGKLRDERGQLDHAPDAPPDIAPLAGTSHPFPNPDPPSGIQDGESEAEAQLYAYLDRARSPKPKGFPPYEALSARLNEFSVQTPYAEPPEDAGGEPPAPQPQPAASGRPRGSDLAWFEEKFSDLKGMLAKQQADKSEIVSINAKLAEIIGRVDRMSAAMPGEKTMAAVETQLVELTHSLKITREESASDADRISRAAREILAATERAEDARAGFENAARHTVKELGQTVAVAASRAAAVTAEHLVAALHHSAEDSGIARVESELRELNLLSRQSSERTTAALERVHDTLRMFLEKSSADRASAASPKKRASVHMPISADAPAYSRPDSDFGSAPVRAPDIGTITLRNPPPCDPNLLRELERASQGLSRTKGLGDRPQTEPPRLPASFLGKPLFREEDKALPLFGLAMVAAVLLIASAALFYIHARSQLPPFHLTLLPDAQIEAALPSPAPSQMTRIEEPGPEKLLTAAAQKIPVLLASADQTPPASKPDAGEDLQALTSAARRGDKEAQFRIGTRFLNDGTAQADPAAAARWLARAADQGHTESQFVLASLYERGAGVPKDEALARELYRKAASAGHARAMHNLGVLLSAQETAQDYEEAARWFQSAAAAGLADSQFNLAILYERGFGVPQDIAQAYFWYQVASLAGDKEATRQAERLKRILPESATLAASKGAGSWRPTVEQMPRLAGASAVRG